MCVMRKPELLSRDNEEFLAFAPNGSRAGLTIVRT